MIILVSGTFLAQSRYYSAQTLSVNVHDNARVATERIASEVRSSMEDGFVVAGARTLTVRSPVRVTGVCEAASSYWTVYMDGGAASMETSEIAGAALRDPSTGAWDYRNATWSYLDGGWPDAAIDCSVVGPADTVGAMTHFNRLRQLSTLFPSAPVKGDLVMLFRETTFTIGPSTLDTMTLGLYRQSYGGSAVEFATGMDSTAQFQYRTGGTSYVDTVAASSLGAIDAVRIVADARLPARSGTLDDATFGWSVNIAVRNLP